jgi:hypothetical protein
MSKTSGLGDGLLIDGVDLSGDTGGLGAIGSSRPTTGVTGIDKSAQERIHLTKNGRIEWQSWFNPAAAAAHAELSTLPLTDRIITYLRGRTLGNPAASMVGKQINYDPNRNADGSLNIAVQAQSNGYGLEWGRQLTAGFQTFGGAGNGSGVDFTDVSTDFGLQAYLQVTAISGGNLVVTLQDSSDGSSDWAAIGAGVAFPSTTVVGAARIQTGRTETIRRHLRAVLSGTFTSATILVAVTRNTSSVVF